MGKRMLDLVGQKFGRLVVVGRVENKWERQYWHCVCECGDRKIAHGGNLKSGNTRSCGCLRREIFTIHGLNNHPLKDTHHSMLYRCFNKKSVNYKYYGGRGITVCKEWLDLKTFCQWGMANGYKKGLQLDRRNNNGNYEPSNCRFVTRKENLSNMQNNLKYKGETAADASLRLGGSKSLVSMRIRYGWSLEKAFTAPVQKCVSTKNL